jgi:L-Ala-D/L-Glu epimerase
MRNLSLRVERFPIAGQFTIARGSKTEAAVVVAEIFEGEFRGRGECVPYTRYKESIESVIQQIEEVKVELEQGANRQRLQSLIPGGAARNAVDCALWDLEAKKTGRPVHELLGLTRIEPVETAFTISLGSVDTMFENARKASHRPILKIKMGSDEGDVERIYAIRKAAPNSKLIADANEGWTAENINHHMVACKEADYSMIEQPIAAANDEVLRGIKHLVPICADESVHGLASLGRLVGLYEFVNIKLDKTGGLTEALVLAKAAREKKFKIMVGCMVSSSLAMAPAMIIAQGAEFVDLDGPLLLAKDREGGLRFEGSTVYPPSAELWG